MQISRINPIINNKYIINKNNENKSYSSDINFKGKPPVDSKFFSGVKRAIDKIYDVVSEPIARGMGKLLDNDSVLNVIKKTVANTNFNDKLISHLNATGSAILSGLYISRTLNNDKLDSEKKKTLAINQAAVWAVSTIMCYTTDGLINNKINRFSEKFKIINKIQSKDDVLLNGIKAAKSIMVFGLIYRFVSPVLVTPIANRIANNINDKKAAERKAGLKTVA